MMPRKPHRSPPRIRLLRRRAGLSQRDLAALLGYRSHSPISRFEHGHQLPAANELLQLQVIFGVVPSGVFPHVLDRAAEAVVARIAGLTRSDANSGQPSVKTAHFRRILESIRSQIAPGLSAHEPWPKETSPEENEQTER